MFERGRKEGAEPGSGSVSGEASGVGAEGMAGARREAGGQATAVIGRSIQIDGDLRGEEDLRVEGEVSGTIQLKSNNLTIGREGKVKADVYAKSIVVEGTVEGDLFGAESIAIRNNAQVVGNLTAPRVSLEDGARFKGSMEMDQQAVDAALGSSRKQPTSIDSAKQPESGKTPGGQAQQEQRKSAG